MLTNLTEIPKAEEIDALMQKSVPVVYTSNTLRQATDQMYQFEAEAVCVLERKKPHKLCGVITFQDIRNYEIKERKKLLNIGTVNLRNFIFGK